MVFSLPANLLTCTELDKKMDWIVKIGQNYQINRRLLTNTSAGDNQFEFADCTSCVQCQKEEVPKKDVTLASTTTKKTTTTTTTTTEAPKVCVKPFKCGDKLEFTKI